MAKLTPNDFATFLLAIGTMLILSRVGAELGKKIGLPIVTAEIIVGVMLGPTLLGNIAPHIYNQLFPFASNAGVSFALDGIFSLAVILLLFVAGLELQLAQVLRQGKIALYTGFGSMVLPFLPILSCLVGSSMVWNRSCQSFSICHVPWYGHVDLRPSGNRSDFVGP